MENGKQVTDIYGQLVFNDKIMRERLPKDVYKAVHKTIENGTHLELDVANAVAAAMKEWALEHGATHFTHWFQPMTGLTAEKHNGILGQRACKGRARCIKFPFGRIESNLRGKRIYGMGSLFSCIH